jgi:hypothetical protein
MIYLAPLDMIYGCRRMIYLLRKYDIISVPHMPQAYLIARSAISYHRYIIRSVKERISLKKAARWAAPFSSFLSMIYLASLDMIYGSAV